jgi:hypothetical protein
MPLLKVEELAVALKGLLEAVVLRQAMLERLRLCPHYYVVDNDLILCLDKEVV